MKSSQLKNNVANRIYSLKDVLAVNVNPYVKRYCQRIVYGAIKEPGYYQLRK